MKIIKGGYQMKTPWMRRLNWMFLGPCLVLLGIGSSILALPFFMADSQTIQILQTKPDPYGYPRPAPNEKNVPVGTSFFLMLGFSGKDATDSDQWS